MEIRNILTFLRVAELESFTKAANELGYAQSTITIQIQQLEKEINASLFDRIGKRIALTPKGQEFQQYAQEICAVIEKIQQMKLQPNQIIGSLRIGILESLLTSVLKEIVPLYHQIFPQVTIKTTTDSTTNLFDKLRRNELDLVLVLDKKVFEKDCVKACSHPENIIFVASPNHPLGDKAVTLSDVLSYPLIVTEQKGIYTSMLKEMANEKNYCLNPILEIDNTTLIIDFVKIDLGIAFLPEYTVAHFIERGELYQIHVTDCAVQFWSQVFYHKNKWVTPAMQGMIQMIENYYNN